MEGEGQKWSLLSKNPPGEGGLGVSAERLELSTNGLKGHCSAIELRARSEEHFIMRDIIRQRRPQVISPAPKASGCNRSKLWLN
jgi:hypothetical protein